MTPAGIVAEPQQIAVDVGHLPRDADLVAMKVVSLLASFAFFVDPVAYLCQGVVAIVLKVSVMVSSRHWAL